MNSGKYIFSQILDFLPMYDFKMCIDRYKGNFNVRTFTCFDQFICMAFAQLTYRDSLRDIEVCLRFMEKKLYHIGIRGKVSRSTLAEANENRDWIQYILKLKNDQQLYKKFSESAFEKISKHYSFQSQRKRFISTIKNIN